MLLELLLGVIVALLLLCAGLLGRLLRRSGHDALLRVTARLEALREDHERIARTVVDEIGFGRREATQAAEEQRDRLSGAIQELREAMVDGIASDAHERKGQLVELGERLATSAQRADMEQQRLLQGVRHDLRSAQAASAAFLVERQLELQESLRELRAGVSATQERDAALAQELAAATHDVHERIADLGRALSGWLEEADGKLATASAHGARETERAQGELATALATMRECFEESSEHLGEAQARERGALATAIESALGCLQDDHARRLERIRHAVEERLPATLEQRLSDSFRPASMRLDEIRRVLDELRDLTARPAPLLS